MTSCGDNRRDDFTEIAISLFSEEGFASVSVDRIGDRASLSSGAFYYYFGSKLHCLYEIMSGTLESWLERFGRATSEAEGDDGLVRVLRSGFWLSDLDVRRNRIYALHRAKLRRHRITMTEDSARRHVEGLQVELEAVWSSYLSREMEVGLIKSADPQLLSKALLGLYTSVWTWYDRAEREGCAELSASFTSTASALLGRSVEDEE